ncbi:transcriptional regulator, MarR family [Rhodopseudomonas palustris HaA2]|uniref:Transcriptional regulator, MarR family n=1 Tax=Rhodopseudomonas palustris (strain HaA2) TaxID=316058 RepID=Q2J2U8_RHOP2|nr:MarR family transcriptional regulator [Rhodopseudomonas palustris]ABD05212.1 transcriptional regulator, MarR family [Rhodopseudomonas palustris HaA2]
MKKHIKDPIAGAAGPERDLTRRFASITTNVAVFLDEIRHYRAKNLGISGPQFAILMAVMDLDEGEGVSVRHVAKAMHVDSSFITTQSKLLEKKALVRRRPDPTDARVVKLSLSDKAYKSIASFAAEEQSLNDFIFEGLSNESLEDLVQQLTALKLRLEKACLKIAGGF